MITTIQKTEIIALIEREKTTLGSYSKVANKCGVAVATITNNALKTENWHLVNDAMWTRIGKELGSISPKINGKSPKPPITK